MIFILTVFISIACSAVVVTYKDKHYSQVKDFSIKRIVKDNIKFEVAAFATFLVVSLISNFLYFRSGSDYVQMYKELLLIYGVFLIAFIDFRERIIPNKIVLALFVIRIGFLIYELIIAFDVWKAVLIYPTLGGLIGGVIIVLAMLVSRKGVGMGDVKLFAIIGLFVSSTKIIPTLFYSILASALFGIVLLTTRKAKLKDSMPMAPFALIGVILNMITSHLGGSL